MSVFNLVLDVSQFFFLSQFISQLLFQSVSIQLNTLLTHPLSCTAQMGRELTLRHDAVRNDLDLCVHAAGGVCHKEPSRLSSNGDKTRPVTSGPKNTCRSDHSE